jgi:DNA relaxase NicK
VDFSAGIVSTWNEAKIRSVLTWVFARGGHMTRMDVALDDQTALVSIARIKQAVDADQAVTRYRGPAYSFLGFGCC